MPPKAEKTKVIVVGGGPAGSAAALVLARAGTRPLILDKARFPRPKLCGGLLTLKTMRLLERLFRLDRDALIRDLIINHYSHEYAILHRDKELISGHYKHPFHFVDRKVLDQTLLQKAREAGAKILEGVGVESFNPDAMELRTDQGTMLKADYVIGADGANSTVRRALPVDKQYWRRGLANTIEISIDSSTLDNPPDYPLLYTGFVRHGYCWVFPNKNRILYGICELAGSGGNLAQSFRRFLSHVGINGNSSPEFKGHPLPYGNYLPEPTFGRTLLAGDAAGMVEPLFGEGIYFAMRTGAAAAMAVLAGFKGQDPARTYAAELKRDVLPELKYSKRLRSALYLVEKGLNFGPIRLFLKAGGDRLLETVHGLRSYKWLRPINLNDHMP